MKYKITEYPQLIRFDQLPIGAIFRRNGCTPWIKIAASTNNMNDANAFSFELLDDGHFLATDICEIVEKITLEREQ